MKAGESYLQPRPDDLSAGLAEASLAAGSLRNYKSAAKKLKAWLKSGGLQLTRKTFLQYITDCYNAGLSYGHVNAVRSYIALKEKLERNCQPITGSFAVRMSLRGYKRKLPRETVRCPVGLTQMKLLMAAPLDDMKRLHYLLGYLFLLRSSEAMDLCEGKGSIEQGRKGWNLFLKRSKADKYSKGVSVFFPNASMPEAVTQELKRLLPTRKEGEKPGAQDLNATIKAVLGENYVFHCLRHGRATDLHQEGYPVVKLQVLGRWATRAALICYLH